MLIRIVGLKQLTQEDDYIYNMDEDALFMVSYKTTGELFEKHFVWNEYEYKELEKAHVYFNDRNGEQLHIYVKFLESMSTKPYFLD